MFVFPVIEVHATTGAINYLIVGGGGGGSNNGGGGAGGVLVGTTTVSAQTYTIAVGSGGTGSINNNWANNGDDSSALSFTAIGGGGGSGNGSGDGRSGGSGGGSGGGFSGGTGVTGQGHNGGTGYTSTNPYTGGGGGGAGTVGQDAPDITACGNGGDGISSSISGTSTYYSGGGGGSIYNNYAGSATPGQGGQGGGGIGIGATGQSAGDGTSNTGGGGGGGTYYITGGTGGSGIVIISYPTGSLTATGGTITTDGAGNTVHTFTSSGTFTVTNPGPTIPVTGVSLNESSHTLTVNSTDQLVATIAPSDATDQTVTFSSSNPSVATVGSSSGLVTAVSTGSATITVTTTDGNFAATDSITVIEVPKTVNKLSKFTATSPLTLGDSLFSDDGTNMTLTSGNLLLQQIGAMIDTVGASVLNFGTTNATTMTFGRLGQYAIFNGNVGIGTTTPGSIFSIGNIANFTTATSSFYGGGINLSSGCFAINGVCIGSGSSGSVSSIAQTFGTGQTGTITFATSSIAYNGLVFGQKITNSGGAFTFAPLLSGILGIGGGGTASTTPLGGILVGNGSNAIKSLVVGNGLSFDGTTLAVATSMNCNSSASPAVCGSSPSGSVAMATGGSTLVINTTAVTANSQIFVTEDYSLGTRLGITCNTTTGRIYSISARTAGTRFTIKSSANPATNKACLSYWIVN